MRRTAWLWLLIGVFGWALLPWFMFMSEGGFWRFALLATAFDESRSGLG